MTNTVETQSTPAPVRGFWGKRRMLLGGVAVAAMAAFAGVAVHAESGPGMMRDGGPGWMMGKPGTPIPVDRIERRADKMLKKLDATPEQTSKVHAIIEAAAKDFDAARKTTTGGPDSVRKLLSAPQVDRAAVETLRTQHLAEMDQTSKVVTKALVDMADVLTPEQRMKLASMQMEHGHHAPI